MNNDMFNGSSNSNKQAATRSMTATRDANNTPNRDMIIKGLDNPNAMDKFIRALGSKRKAEVFVQTIRNVVCDPQNKRLAECTPASVLNSCMAAAVTGLTIDPAFGKAAIVPYGNKATFMPMKNGLVELAKASQTIHGLNAGPLYEGDLSYYNEITSDFRFNEERHERKNLIGYFAWAREYPPAHLATTLPVEKWPQKLIWWSIEKLKAHGKQYSPSRNSQSSLWYTNFPAMAEKTMLKQLLNKWETLETVDGRLELAMRFMDSTPSSMDIEKAVPEYPETEIEEVDVEDVTGKGADDE